MFCTLLVVCVDAVAAHLPRLGNRELICLLLFTCNYVVSVRKGFLLVLGLGCYFIVALPQKYYFKIIILKAQGLQYILVKI